MGEIEVGVGVDEEGDDEGIGAVDGLEGLAFFGVELGCYDFCYGFAGAYRCD